MSIEESEMAMKIRSHPAAAAGATFAFTMAMAPAAAKIGFGMSSPIANVEGRFRRSTSESQRGVVAGPGGRRSLQAPSANSPAPAASFAQSARVDAVDGFATVKCPNAAAQTA